MGSEGLLRSFSGALDALARRGARRFSAGAITREAGIDRSQAVSLLDAASEAGIVVPTYELECPNCGNLVRGYPDMSFLGEGMECPTPSCANEFKADLRDVRVLFDFHPGVVLGGEDPG